VVAAVVFSFPCRVPLGSMGCKCTAYLRLLCTSLANFSASCTASSLIIFVVSKKIKSVVHFLTTNVNVCVLLNIKVVIVAVINATVCYY